MKLYVVAGSGNCRKVQAVIKKLEIPVDIQYLDFFEGDLKKAEFLAMNPNGRVPTLVDDEFTLWESNAIMQYLADKVPGHTLFPVQAQMRADIVRWQCWELAHFNNAFATVAFETVLKNSFLNQPANQAVVDTAIESLHEFAKVLDSHLAGRQYVVGDAITLADYSLINIEAFKEVIPFDWSAYPELNAYFDRVRNDPHWASTAPESPEAVGRRPSAA